MHGTRDRQQLWMLYPSDRLFASGQTIVIACLASTYLMVLTGNCMNDPEFNPWRKWSSTQFKQGWKCLNKQPRKFNGDVCQQQSLVHQRWEIQWIKWNIQSFKVAISFNCPQKSMVAVPDQADVKSFSWKRMAWDLVHNHSTILFHHIDFGCISIIVDDIPMSFGYLAQCCT